MNYKLQEIQDIGFNVFKENGDGSFTHMLPNALHKKDLLMSYRALLLPSYILGKAFEAILNKSFEEIEMLGQKNLFVREQEFNF